MDKRQDGRRASRLVEDVVRTADQAVEELNREHEESAASISETLHSLNEEDSLAHLESRLLFVETQVEKIAQRRNEMSGAVKAELALMQARVADALAAVAATSQDQRRAVAAFEELLEERMESERRVLAKGLAAFAAGLEARLDANGRAVRDSTDSVEGMVGDLFVSRDAQIAELSSAVAELRAMVEAISQKASLNVAGPTLVPSFADQGLIGS